METETTVLTGDTSNESIEALNFGKRKQQKKAGKRVPKWPPKKKALICLAVALTAGVVIGIWQLVRNWHKIPFPWKRDDEKNNRIFQKKFNCFSSSTPSMAISFLEYSPFRGMLEWKITKKSDGSIVKQRAANKDVTDITQTIHNLSYDENYLLTVTGTNLEKNNHSGNIGIAIDGTIVLDEMLGEQGQGDWSGYEYSFCLVRQD